MSPEAPLLQVYRAIIRVFPSPLRRAMEHEKDV
jgi:hypothetical protein